jgi:UDP:flavonoid glycosyltransferase YjiC (YdhE family)
VRVLFTCVVGHGHFNPLVPLAKAFGAAGHDVAFATDPGFVSHVRGVGFEAHPAGIDMPEAFRRFLRTMPDWRAVAPQDQMRYIVPGLFAGVRIEPMLADLGPLIRDWRPDLLIHDPGEMAGGIAAEVAGIAHAEHSFGVLRPTEIAVSAIEALEPVCRRLGVRNPGVSGLGDELYVDVCPPALQRPEIADRRRVLRLRPIGFDDAPGTVIPTWLDDVGVDRPLVYVTMGTEFNQRPEIFRTVLDRLADGPIDIVVTVGSRGDPEAIEPRSANVRIERYVPQSRLLARASVFVSHGGSGALLGAASAGVPMLAIPQGADQFLNAERIVESGIGLRLLPDELDPDAVNEAVTALLEDRRYADRVGEVRSGIADMPPPDEVVPELVRLAG